MTKILYVSNTANFSKFNRPFMKWCLEQGWQVDYCAPNDEVIADCSHHFVVPIPRSPFSKGIFSCIKQLKKILNEEQYDIIHCHTPMGGAIARFAARKLYKKNKVKIIYTAHGFHFYKGAPLLNWMVYYPVEKFLTKYTDVLITINKEDFERAQKKFSKNCKVVLMNGVGVNLTRFTKITSEEKDQIRKILGFSHNDFIITNVAELNKNKNQVFLISAIPELIKEIPNLKVAFLGKETIPIARKLVSSLKLEHICTFYGYRKDVDLFEKASDICFSASIREGFGLGILESMACGKVCVCSENRGHSSLIENGINGLLFDLNDSEMMKGQILRIYNDCNFANKLATQAFEDSKQYDVKEAVIFTSELYTELINEK